MNRLDFIRILTALGLAPVVEVLPSAPKTEIPVTAGVIRKETQYPEYFLVINGVDLSEHNIEISTDSG